MADDTRSTINVAIRRSSKTPAIFLAASFTEPAWEPVELDVKPLPPSASEEATVQTNGDVPDTHYEFSKSFEVASGKHHYKFRKGLEGTWFCDKDVESTVDNEGMENNVLVVEPVTATGKATDPHEMEVAKEASNEAIASDAGKADEVKVNDREKSNVETTSDDKNAGGDPAEASAEANIKYDGGQVKASQKAETDDDKPDAELSQADATIKPEILKDDAPEAVTSEDEMPKEVVPEVAQTPAAAQEANTVDDPPAAKTTDASGHIPESKSVEEPLKESVEDTQEAPVDPTHEPAPSEQPIVAKEPEDLKMEVEEHRDTELAEKGGLPAPVADTKAEPAETETPADKDGESEDNQPKVKLAEELEPTEPEAAIEPSATIEKDEDAIKAEEPVDALKGEPVKEDSKPEEVTADIELHEPERKVIEEPSEPEAPEKGNEAPELAPAAAREAEEPAEPAPSETVKPVEPTTTVDAPADAEPAQSQENVAVETLLVNGDVKKEEADDTPEVAELPTQQQSETTPEADIVEPETAEPVAENNTEEPVVEVPVEVTAPESDQLPMNDDKPAGDAAKGVESHEIEADREEAVVEATTGPEVAEPIAEAAKDDVTVVEPAEASVEPEQQKAEEPLSLPEAEAAATVAPQETKPEPSELVDDNAPVEDIAVKSVVDDDAVDIPAIEEPAGAEVAPAVTVTEAAPEPEDDIPEEPETLKPEETSIPEPESVPEQESASQPAESNTPAAAEEPVASKTEDDAILEPVPAPEQDAALKSAETNAPVGTNGPEALEFAEDTAPEAKVVSGDESIDTIEGVTTSVDEPEASEPAENVAAPESTPEPTPEAEVVVDQTPKESVGLAASKPIDNAVPAPDSAPEAAAIAATELGATEQPAAPEPADDPASKSADLAQSETAIETATTDVPEAGEEPTDPEASKPVDHTVPETESAVQTTTSDALDTAAELIEPPTSQGANDTVPESTEPASTADIATLETPEAPEELKETETLEPAEDVVPQPEPEPAVVATNSDILQAPVESTQPEPSIDADNAVAQPAEPEPESAMEAPTSEAAEVLAESIEPEVLETANNAITEMEPVADTTPSWVPETPAEPTGLEGSPPTNNGVAKSPTEAEVVVPDPQESREVATVEPETSALAEEPEGAIASDEVFAPVAPPAETPAAPAAEEELKGSIAINNVLESTEAEEVTPAGVETVDEPASVEEREAPTVPQDADATPEPAIVDVTEAEDKIAGVPEPAQESEASKSAEDNEPSKVTDNADNIVPEHKENDVVAHGQPRDSADVQETEPETVVTELPVTVERVEDVIPEPAAAAADEPEVVKAEDSVSVPEAIVTGEPEQSTPADEPEVAPVEGAAAAVEPETKEPNLATETPVEPEYVEVKPPENEQPTTDSITPVDLSKERDAPHEISQDSPEPAAENQPEVVTEPTSTATADVATETHSSVSKNLEVPEKANDAAAPSVESVAKEDDLDHSTETAVLEPSSQTVPNELDNTAQSSEESPVPAPDEIKAPKSEAPEAPNESAVEVVQPPSMKTSDYPLIETPVESSTTDPAVATNNQEELPQDAVLETSAKHRVDVPEVPVEKPLVETNGTTSSAPVEDVPQEPPKELGMGKVITATLTTAVVGAGIAQVVSDNKERLTEKGSPSLAREAPTEVVASVVEAPSSIAPEITPKAVDTPNEEAKADKVVVNGNKSAPVPEVDVDAAESVPAPVKAQEAPLAETTGPMEPANSSAAEPSTKQAENKAPQPIIPSQPDPSNSTEPTSTTGSAEPTPADPTAATPEPPPSPDAAKLAAGGVEEPRPATGDRSVTSITIHKRENFFKALWHAIFTSFFGGIFSAFRRGHRDNPRQ